MSGTGCAAEGRGRKSATSRLKGGILIVRGDVAGGVSTMKGRTITSFVATVGLAAGLSFALATFCFVFRDTRVLAWSERSESLPYQPVRGDNGSWWTGSSFGGLGWTEVEQTVVLAQEAEPLTSSAAPLPWAPYWSSMAELPIPNDDSRLCPTCALVRVDGAFGWPFRIIAFRAESAWSWNPTGPNGASEPSFMLQPLIGSVTLAPISPLAKRQSYSGDLLVPGGILWPGLLANTSVFAVLFWLAPITARMLMIARGRRRVLVGICATCGNDLGNPATDSNCPECGAAATRRAPNHV